MPADANPADQGAGSADPDRPDGPVVTSDSVTWHLPAGAVGTQVSGVDFAVDWQLEGGHGFAADDDGGWRFELIRPPAHRLEYQLIVHAGDGDHFVTDPTNPRSVPGPFGDKSEIRFPDYSEPDWLGTETAGTRAEFADPGADGGALDTPVPITLYTPPGLDDATPAPLLIAHDGSDMADRGSLLAWASARPGPLRVALLDPPHGHRDAWYGADPDYADHIGTVVIPALRERLATSATIGLGASLGAVAMVTIHRRHPDSLDALALQSGSFFTAELDPQESGWAQFEQVCTAVAAFAAALPTEVRTVPVLMTVGAIEENRANNEQLAGALSFQGYPVDARIVPDAHTMIGWRDAWSPGLDELVAPFLSAPDGP